MIGPGCLRVAVVGALVIGCKSSTSEKPPAPIGTAAGKAVMAAMAAAEQVRAPWRCAATSAGAMTGTVGDGERAWRREGRELHATRTRLVIAAVAQARGARIGDGLRAAMAAEHPDVVVAVGGMGMAQDELEKALGGLTVPGAIVIALPGDSESWPALQAAVEKLAAGGAAIVDGGAVRIVDAGVARMVTLPGLAQAGQLGAGPDGCVHDGEDVAEVVATLAAAEEDAARIVVGPRAPQGEAAVASGDHDRVAGIHAGDPALTTALMSAKLTLTIHGLVDGAPTAGAAPTGAGTVIAAGSLDPAPRWTTDGRPLRASVTIATVDERGVRWRSLAADAW